MCSIFFIINIFLTFVFRYESNENMTIQVSTKVCSFGKQVVEKLETEYASLQNGRFLYKIARSPMCEYMINFIHKLKHLPEKYMMNSVLENFTILQVRSSYFNLYKKPRNYSKPKRFVNFFNLLSFLLILGDNQPRYARNSTLHCVCF